MSDSNMGSSIIYQQASRTDATVEAYLKRGELMWKMACRETGIPFDVLKPSDFVSWLDRKMMDLFPASRRQYLAAARELLNLIDKLCVTEPDPDWVNAGNYIDLEFARKRLDEMRAGDYPRPQLPGHKRRTSRQKAKKCDAHDLKQIAVSASSIRGKWVVPAINWMTVNLHVGLRPSEWRHAKLVHEKSKNYLVVRNGKNTNGRANGKYRVIDVTGLRPVEMRLLQAQLRTVAIYAAEDKSWHQYYCGVRQTIYRMTRQVLNLRKTYPSLYSTRHQFSANAKSVGMTKAEVAALMGHASDQTATAHYGKKRCGQGDCRALPLAEDVERVQVRSQSMKTRITPKA